MSLVYPLGFAQVTFRHSQIGAAGESVWTCGMDVRTAGGMQAVLDGMSSAYGDTWRSNMSQNVTYIGAAMTTMGEGGLERFDTVVGSGPGGQAGQTPPSSVAVLVRKRTSLAGRKFRGRLYWPGVTNAAIQNINSNLLTDTQFSDWTTKWHNLFTAFETVNAFPHILHSSALPVPTPILQFDLQQRLATQRGRLRD